MRIFRSASWQQADVSEIVSAAWVITVSDSVLQDHSVVIHEGKILDILPTSDVDSKYRTTTRTNLPDSALLPGFVNSHTHTPMTLLRGVSDDIPLRKWLQDTIWPLEGQLVDEAFCRDGAELAVLEMILGGTTTFNDMYFFPASVAEVVVRSGIRAAMGMLALEFPTRYGTGPDDYLAKGLEMREKFEGEDRLSFTVSLHAPYTCSEDTIRKGGALSEKLGLPLHIHLHETEEECRASAEGDKESLSCHLSDEKCTPIANFKRLGLLNSRLCAVHMVCLSDEEISWCGEADISVVHCPMSNMKLACGFSRVADLLKAGVNVAIGTDGASSNNTLDMMAEMKMAALLAKAVGKDASAVPAAKALEMATLNGAKALGLEQRIGSLSVGKEADMVAVDFAASPGSWPLPCRPEKPGFDPVTHLVYSCGRSQVSDVWVKGKRLMEGRKVLTLPADEIFKKTQMWMKAVAEVLPSSPDKSSVDDRSCVVPLLSCLCRN